MEEEKPLVKLADKAKKIRLRFSELLAKTNQEHPRSQDVKALSDLLNGNQSLELWRTVLWRTVASALRRGDFSRTRRPALEQLAPESLVVAHSSR